MWLKSAGLMSRLKLAFYDFLQVPGAIGIYIGVAQKMQKITNNRPIVYCL